MPRLLAIGDIHGCSRALDALLLAVKLEPSDQLVTVGDYVDRGPDSRGVLDRIIDLHGSGRLVALRGNHELMMLHARSSSDSLLFWLAVGGQQALESYARPGQAARLDDISEAHLRFLRASCVDWHETERHFFVHGSVTPDSPLDLQPSALLHWEMCTPQTPPHCSGKVMVCGHAEQRGGWPLVLDHAICIDTWAYGGGWLTALDVLSSQIWQANQQGETRKGWIDQPF